MTENEGSSKLNQNSEKMELIRSRERERERERKRLIRGKVIEWNKLDKEEKEVGWNTCVRNTKEGKESFFAVRIGLATKKTCSYLA